MLPSLTLQVFNSLINAIEAGLLIYIALQSHLNNLAIREKQADANLRLDTIFSQLKRNPIKKDKKLNGR